MLTYVVQRLLWAIPVLLGVLIAVFIGLHVVPGNVAQSIAGAHATAAQIRLLTHQLGLDKPLWVQFWAYFTQIVQGHFGTSLQYHNPVAQDIGQAFPITLQLTIAAFLIASVVGILSGVAAAVYRNTWFDSLIMVLVLIGISMPIFWTGVMLILAFGVDLPLFPFSSVLTAGTVVAHITGMPILDAILSGNWSAAGDAVGHLVLPAITLATYPVAFITRMTRSAMIEVLSQDYLRTARAKGLRERVVVWKHALRNASLPIVTVLGVQVGALLSGAVLTETIFSIPGIGRLMIQAILFRDYPVVQGVVILAASVFVLVNLLVDLLYARLDPRIHYS
ncbi:MAG: ABC transporter permease [Thermaerobacter sp.]|nr:ABC transporter permease [Thermaerobacter sp.]